MLFPLAS